MVDRIEANLPKLWELHEIEEWQERVIDRGAMSRREKSPKRMRRSSLSRRPATPRTPVPKWKQAFDDCQLYEAGIPMATPDEAPQLSARKLAAKLYEGQELPLPAALNASLYTEDSPGWISSPLGITPDVNASPLSQPEYIRSESTSSCKSTSRLKTGELQRLLTRSGTGPGDDSAHASPPTPTLIGKQRHIPHPLFATKGKGDMYAGATTTSGELLKVFNQIRMLEAEHNSSLNLTTALHTQLMQARARVRELELPHRLRQRQMEGLVSRFSEEKKTWKMKEKERVNAAVQAVKEELEEERKAKQRLESANRKLMKELTEAQTATSKAVQELERERKARLVMEEVCRELTQETGAEKAEAEEQKRQAQQAREALEEERRMLQTAEVWREERVQMKLGEARLALETKSAALDAMRIELEAFLASQRDSRPYDVTTLGNAQVLHKVLSAVHYDTSISTFPPTSSISSMSSTSSFPPTSDLMYATPLDTDSSQGSRNRAYGHLFYPEGIPDAD